MFNYAKRIQHKKVKLKNNKSNQTIVLLVLIEFNVISYSTVMIS